MDIVCIDEIGFMTSISHPLCCWGCKHVENNTKDSFHEVLIKPLKCNGGHQIKQIECSNEFKSIVDEVNNEPGVKMNCMNAQDHVRPAKRNNRTIKETIGCNTTDVDATLYPSK